MARMRTFIAIDLGKSIRERCQLLQDSLSTPGADVKWVETHNVHLTLLFLGEVNDRDVPPICEVVAEQCAGQVPFTLTVAGAGCFPNPRRPRILWAGVTDGSAQLVGLHDLLERPLLELGCYRREDRPFTPHVTLGRRRNERDDEALAKALARHADWQGGSVSVREVLVLSSELTRDGPVYNILSRARLKAAG